MVYKLGAHLSVAGGYHNALHKIVAIGGTCLQIFSSSPRSWHFIPPTKDQVEQFLHLRYQLNIDPIYFHASYLINLANEWERTSFARKSLIDDLTLASRLGIKGVIVHIGSSKDLTFLPKKHPKDTTIPNGPFENVIFNIQKILSETPKDTFFIIENAGNKKIGKDLKEIAMMMKNLNNSRVRVCLDTCHLHSAGYDLSTKGRLDTFVEDFDTLIGLEKLECWHLNDSRDPFGSSRDRHANIGEGTLGIETFRLILNHPKLKHLPFIIETPGFDDKGPDKQNLDILKTLIQ